MAAFSEFLAYKTRVPVRGAILLNEEMDSVVLVKGWKKGANWSFPRGKINKGEPDLDCAIREVYEETGFDVRAANLVKDEDSVKSIEVTMREQHMRLFVFPGVPIDTHFEPRTRKEISKIEWYKLSELPTLKKNKQHDEGMAVANANKFYMVAPFLHPLKKWIAQQKRSAAKDQTSLKPPLQTEGHASVDAALHLADLAAYGGGVSDLPEVDAMVPAPDASSHIKQLLKIGGGLSGTVQPQASASAQPPAVDQMKSNALLTLLRTGSQGTVPHVQKETVTPQPSVPSAVPTTQQPHLAPNFFPGFPQQQQHMAPSNFMQQTSVEHLPGQQPGIPQHAMHTIQHQQFPNSRQPELPGSSAMPQFPQIPHSSYHGLHPQSPPPNITPARNVAPFQQTGDPQFSQLAQPSQAPGAIVPPASKLPPPKLTSHSLALLGFFKDGSTTPKTPHAAPFPVPAPVPASVPASAPAPGPSQERKTSLHQDSLLNLFKGPRGSPASQPVELLGQPIRAAPPAERQILRRPPSQAGPPQQGGPAASNPQGVAPAAIVPGPPNVPRFEQSPKSMTKRMANGSNRRSNSNRREQPQAQPLSSPITILPRPQGAKRDVPASGPPISTAQALAQPKVVQPATPELVKPFQPQILRRSEKTGYDNLLRRAPKMDDVERKPSFPGLQTNPDELTPNASFDRRPSQTHAQKEALLSLFGKPQVSPSLPSAVQLDSRAVNQQPSNVSGLVSPLSSLHLASGGESVSGHGTPSENDHASASINRVSSPSNKAFLLSYLQGAAKGGN